jgi:alpha-keto-acid decarboxylase
MSHAPVDRPAYAVADYLLDRLAELGLDRMFGVPGDYTLGLLDHVIEHARIRWTGCTNELNASYAADGYGRLRGIAAVCTTFGVGELSAINGIAGSYAEHVPVLHLVGAPTTAAQRDSRPVHHTLGDGRFALFLDMHATITCARAALTATNAATEIDRVLLSMRDQHLPGYLLLPADVAQARIEPPTAPLPARVDTTDPEALAEFVQAAKRLLAAAGAEVAVLAGLMVHRLGATGELTRLITDGGMPFATTVWGKTLVDESTRGFVGMYSGASSDEATRHLVEDSAALIMAGVQLTDLNSGLFTQHLTRARTVEVTARTASVGAAVYGPIELPTALAALADIVTISMAASTEPETFTQPEAFEEPDLSSASGALPTTAVLDQESLWDGVGSHLRDGDIVLADQGTAFYGMAPRRLPRGVTFVGQPLWASIGYTLPALLGACTARPGRRGVLLIGDGAAQLTVQELSTIITHQIPALIVVVDNDGYTVERAIHGPTQPYNDIARWDWTLLPAALGGVGVTASRVTTTDELLAALHLADTRSDGITVIQAVVPRDDVPPLLDSLTRVLGRTSTPTEPGNG